ncbi:alanine racemase [Sediminihabitans luteus]|uniref:Alanine racemase n=1 Tax=Sediminihabitans luteus TaxID=1138585 RepID=A0A2M9CZ98_9CELL|nr:alanine racemase [Sediminihabitans luteus]PJJ77217.1 alanine racemase [Sediminihabitans luteus]GII98665.1 alanine racemase [Sediminihabitans luteus]
MSDDRVSTSTTFPARAVVDLDAIAGNVAALAAHAPSAAVMAVVKADAYGHGLVPAARAALAGGATWLGTAQVAEALALRAAGITAADARVLTWLYAPGAPLAALLEADVDVSVHADWALAEVVAAARATGRVARVHLKVDTGLGRNGLVPPDLARVLPDAMTARAEGLIDVVGVWSHLAFADEPGNPTVLHQAEVFDDAVRLVEQAGAALEVRHLANSAATLTAPRMHYDLVRPGIAVYGLTPVPQIASSADHGLTPAMTLEARLANVKRVPAGQGVSYAHRYVTTQETTLGVVPLGYADGIPRHASGEPGHPGGPVLVGGADAADAASGALPDGARVLHVAGRVCMDQLVLDLGPYATERAGDVVTLFGAGAGLAHGGAPTAQDWADAAGTISYEIVTRLGARVPRTYVGGLAGDLREQGPDGESSRGSGPHDEVPYDRGTA